MKKIYLLLLSAAFGIGISAQPFSSVWTKLANVDFAWFTADNNVTSIAYNPATDKLLVSKRNDRIFIINPATGAEEGTLNTTGVGSEGFKYNKIRVTSDGVIYAISLATGAGNCIIYRWANQAASPTVCATFAVTERCGDSFGLSGSGNSTILYASGAGNAGGVAGSINIYMLNTVNGLNFFTESKINVTTATTGVNQWANRAVEPVSNSLTSDLWINAGGGPARRITVGSNSGGVRTGTVAYTSVDGVGNGQASNGYGGLKHFTTPNGNKFLIFAGGNNSNAGTRMTMLNVTDEANVTTYGKDSLYQGDVTISYVTNGNGTGDAAVKQESNGEYTVFYLSTNNGIQATKTGDGVLPVSLGSFEVAARNKAALLNWTTVSESNSQGFQVERSFNGTDFNRIGFASSRAVNGNSTTTLNYQFEDSRLLTGKVFYRIKQVDRDGKFNFSEVRSLMVKDGRNTLFALRNNPVADQIILGISSTTQKNYQVTVNGNSGSALISRKVAVNASENTITLPASGLAAGTYYLHIRDLSNQEKPEVIKLIKQ